jgi:hypothetical protein
LMYYTTISFLFFQFAAYYYICSSDALEIKDRYLYEAQITSDIVSVRVSIVTIVNIKF